MSETAIALATLFVVSMMGVGLALFLRGSRERFDHHVEPRPHGPRRRG